MIENSTETRSRIVTRAFTPAAATADDWRAYHRYMRRRAAEEAPEDPIPEDNVRQRDMLTEWPLFETHRVLALIDGEIVGSLAMWTRRKGTPDYEEHARFIGADAGVRRDARRRGVATVLLAVLAAFMREGGYVTATMSARVGGGTAYLDSIGAAEKHRVMESRLDLASVDRVMLRGWEAAVDRSGELIWEIHAGRVPLDRFEELIPALTTMFNSQPLGTLELPPMRYDMEQIKAWYADMDAHGGDHIMVLLRNGDELVAMSEASWIADFPDRAFQNLTAVAPSWRGKGLAKAIKARMLRAVSERRPEIGVIITVNANVNAAMLAINRQLGFVHHRDVRTYQIGRDGIEAALAARTVSLS